MPSEESVSGKGGAPAQSQPLEKHEAVRFSVLLEAYPIYRVRGPHAIVGRPQVGDVDAVVSRR